MVCSVRSRIWRTSEVLKELDSQPIRCGKYRLLDRISIGGMAEVWRAVEADGDRRMVAIKRLLPGVVEHPELVSMFIGEARIMLELAHPNIARVYELGETTTGQFIALEYIRGKDLRKVMDRAKELRQPPPISLTCYVISRLCRALDHAHRLKDESDRLRKLVHRDVSPSNVLVGFKGELKLIDFGIAQAGDASPDRGPPNGKLSYMSPEQARGSPIDGRSDIFSVGVCLYEMLTGERPFPGDSHPAMTFGLDFQIPSASAINEAIPAALESVVVKALAGDTGTRYQDAAELAADLEALLQETGNFEPRNLVAYMHEIFPEETPDESHDEQQVPDRSGGPGLVARSLLPKVSAVGPLLGNSVSPGADDGEAEPAVVVDRGAGQREASVPTQRSESSGGEPGAVRVWAPQVRVSEAVRSSVRAFREPAGEPATATRSSEASAADSAPEIPVATGQGAIGKGRAIVWGMLGAAVVVAAAIAVFYLAREANMGFLAVDLPADLRGKNAVVAFRGELWQMPEQGKPLYKTKAGKGVLTVQAEGFQTFSQTVEVNGKHQMTEVSAKLAPIPPRNAQLAVLAEPDDAEVRIDGSVVAAGGSAFYLAEIPVGTEHLVQVGRAGYRGFESRVKASTEGEQVKLHAKLQPLDYLRMVQSYPTGAMVWANGQRLGKTPIEIRLSASTTELTLSKRCHQAAQLPVSTSEEASLAPIKVLLKRLPSCR
jgi:serine/threonine protein kinase